MLQLLYVFPLDVYTSRTWTVFTFSVPVPIERTSTMKFSSVIWSSARTMGTYM